MAGERRVDPGKQCGKVLVRRFKTRDPEFWFEAADDPEPSEDGDHRKEEEEEEEGERKEEEDRENPSRRPNPEWLAAGCVEDTRSEDGWIRLDLRTNPEAPPLQAMFGAGFLEGSLTHEYMWYTYLSIMDQWFRVDRKGGWTHLSPDFSHHRIRSARKEEDDGNDGEDTAPRRLKHRLPTQLLEFLVEHMTWLEEQALYGGFGQALEPKTSHEQGRRAHPSTMAVAQTGQTGAAGGESIPDYTEFMQEYQRLEDHVKYLNHERFMSFSACQTDQDGGKKGGKECIPPLMLFRGKDPMKWRVDELKPWSSLNATEYWYEVRLLLAQLDGLVEGYQASAPPARFLTIFDLWTVNLNGDLGELVAKYCPPTDEVFEEMKREEEDHRERIQALARRIQKEQRERFERTYREHHGDPEDEDDDDVQGYKFKEEYHEKKHDRHDHHRHDDDDDQSNNRTLTEKLSDKVYKLLVDRRDRCTGLVRVTDCGENIFVGHDTWDSFGLMLRIYKHYDLRVKGHERNKYRKLSFSSTPGFLSSVDDFYISSAGLVILETTTGVFDERLYRLIEPRNCVMAWMRGMIANYNAKNGAEWAIWFSHQNSGTYNSQWVVVDMNRFSPKSTSHSCRERKHEHKDTIPILENGLLTVCEQIPLYIRCEDLTDVLEEKGFFGSTNSPFFDDIFKISGFHGMVAEFGDIFTTHKNPRARIFEHRAPKVQNLKEFQKLMGYNDWKNDPLSLGNPGNAIMSREDLLHYTSEFEGSHRRWRAKTALFVGIDVKVTDFGMAQKMTALARNGPTADKQPVFCWSDRPDVTHISHHGQPDCFNFSFVEMGPERLPEDLLTSVSVKLHHHHDSRGHHESENSKSSILFEFQLRQEQRHRVFQTIMWLATIGLLGVAVMFAWFGLQQVESTILQRNPKTCLQHAETIPLFHPTQPIRGNQRSID